MLPGYADYETYRKELESIARSRLCVLRSLGRTLGGREVYVLEIGSGKRHDRPAILIVGSVHPPHLLGSELAVRLARRLVEEGQSDAGVARVLGAVTFYVIPRPSPDACEAMFRRPYVERAGNERPADDDHDGADDEDGPDDLDGDGRITMMRVEAPAGQYLAHPKDPRVLAKADPRKNQRGRWSLHVEGRDNDADEQQGEDPPGGTEFNRNFTFNYGYFERGAGPHQVSEVETRAVADFAFDHPNIAAVLAFTLEDNLMRPWKPHAAGESAKIKTRVLASDAGYFDYVAEEYRKIRGLERAPESPEGRGSFSQWAYFHFGRWSFGCRGWWVPGTEDVEGGKSASHGPSPPTPLPASEAKGEEAKKVEAKGLSKPAIPTQQAAADAKDKPDEKAAEARRVAQELSALKWFTREKIDGFVPWKRIEHPDFPGRAVEVGGFAPFVRLNPPARELEKLADAHWKFLRRLVELLPRLSIEELKAEPLGEGVWRVKATVLNQGFLPTVSEMGRITGEPLPLQAALELPKAAALVTGHARVQLPTLAGSGGKAEPTWLVRASERGETPVRLRVWSLSVLATRQQRKRGQP